MRALSNMGAAPIRRMAYEIRCSTRAGKLVPALDAMLPTPPANVIMVATPRFLATPFLSVTVDSEPSGAAVNPLNVSAMSPLTPVAGDMPESTAVIVN